jgi:mono/diheme cytochrome c family protein
VRDGCPRRPENQKLSLEEKAMSRSFRKYLLIAAAIGALLLLASVQLQAQGGDAGALFKSKCAMCHGADAAGKTPMGTKMNIPDLRAPEVQKKPVTETAALISKGKNKMPGYEGKLTGEQISQLAKYVHELKK